MKESITWRNRRINQLHGNYFNPLFVVLSFAVLGLGSFLPSMQLKRDFITSGKTSIEIQEIASEFNKMRARLAPNMSINEAIEAGLLDSLIAYLSNEAILLEEARINGLVATREQQKIELLTALCL